MGEILGSKVPSRYIQHRVNSGRGIAGLSCIFCESTALFVSDLVGNHIVDFLMVWLKFVYNALFDYFF